MIYKIIYACTVLPKLNREIDEVHAPNLTTWTATY